MTIIKCKMCGGDVELAADKTFGTCEFCGSTMTFPKVDDDQRAAAFNRGNHFRRIGEFDKALAVYERIVREDNNDAEAHWCCALCRFGIEYVEDPATYEYLPTCHRASFDSFLEDVDYLAAVTHSEGITKRQYQKDAAKIAEVQRGILATSQNAEPYDVFICYKESDENGERTRDSLMAQDVYYQLTDQGYRVFFSRITLEDVAGKQYEPYIFAALNSAKVMIVIGTKPEHMSAVWVKNEWSRFLAMMKKNHSKLLLPCYRDMDPYDMPEQLSVLQSYDMSKIGFIQDLVRGIKKVLDADKKPEPVPQTAVAQQTGSASVNALLKRGNMALEDEEWERADAFFEDVLNLDPECGEAYLGKVLAQREFASMDDYIQCVLHESKEADKERMFYTFGTDSEFSLDAHIAQISEECAVETFFEAERIAEQYDPSAGEYLSVVPVLVRLLEREQEFWQKNRTLSRAIRYDKTGQITQQKEKLLSSLQQRLADSREAELPMHNAAKAAFEAYLKETDAAVRELSYVAQQKRAQRLSMQSCETKKVPVYVKAIGQLVVCPRCNIKQMSNRNVCWNCGQLFMNGRKDPYWCAHCGRPGPYGDECPECGCNEKIYNREI